MLIKLSKHSKVMFVNLATVENPESQVAVAYAFNFSSWEAEAGASL